MDNSIYYTIGAWALFIFFSWSCIKQLLSTENLEPVEKYGCPNCNSEYQKHIRVCADCNEELLNYSTFNND